MTTTSASMSHLAGVVDAARCCAAISTPEAVTPVSAAAPSPAPLTKSRRLIRLLRVRLRSIGALPGCRWYAGAPISQARSLRTGVIVRGLLHRRCRRMPPAGQEDVMQKSHLAAVCALAMVAVAVEPRASAQTPAVVPVTDAVLANPDHGDWLHISRTYDQHRFSPLTQITRSNVGRLRMVWSRGL